MFSDAEKEHLASLCFPEGAHLHSGTSQPRRIRVVLVRWLTVETLVAAEDWSYIFWRDTDNQRDGVTLYGTGFYHSQRDEKYVVRFNSIQFDSIELTMIGPITATTTIMTDDRYKRGAMQRAVLLLSYKPYFDIFEGFLRMTMMKYWQQNMDDSVIAHVFETVNTVFSEGLLVRCHSVGCLAIVGSRGSSVTHSHASCHIETQQPHQPVGHPIPGLRDAARQRHLLGRQPRGAHDLPQAKGHVHMVCAHVAAAHLVLGHHDRLARRRPVLHLGAIAGAAAARLLGRRVPLRADHGLFAATLAAVHCWSHESAVRGLEYVR